MADKDFEVLYKDTPVHVRGNANLPPRFIYHINRLEYIRQALDRDRAHLQGARKRGTYDLQHQHDESCWKKVQTWVNPLREPDKFAGTFADQLVLDCDKWNWKMHGLSDEDHNPLRDYTSTYLQLSRADSMKGSEQTVRGFQAAHNLGVDIDGTQPNLTPSLPMSRNDRDVRIVVGTANEAKRSWRGLRGGR